MLFLARPACATDSVFFYAGSEDGRVHMWSTESGMKVAVLDGKHQGPISTLQFNPRNMMFASACTNMVRFDVRQCAIASCLTNLFKFSLEISSFLSDILAPMP